MSPVSLPQRIVVGIDGSEQSFRALDYAAKLGSLSKSKLTLVHVLLLPPGASAETIDSVRRDLSKRVSEMMTKAAGIVKSSNLEVETRTVETNSSVVKSIIDFAGEQKADLLVVGTRGTSGMGRLMLGSTAAGAAAFASCPVLTVR